MSISETVQTAESRRERRRRSSRGWRRRMRGKIIKINLGQNTSGQLLKSGPYKTNWTWTAWHFIKMPKRYPKSQQCKAERGRGGWGRSSQLKPAHHSSYLLRTNKTSYQIKANATGVAPGKGSGSGSCSGLGTTVKFEWRRQSASTINRIPWPILTRGSKWSHTRGKQEFCILQAEDENRLNTKLAKIWVRQSSNALIAEGLWGSQ